jgi:hypothetical protein
MDLAGKCDGYRLTLRPARPLAGRPAGLNLTVTLDLDGFCGRCDAVAFERAALTAFATRLGELLAGARDTVSLSAKRPGEFAVWLARGDMPSHLHLRVRLIGTNHADSVPTPIFLSGGFELDVARLAQTVKEARALGSAPHRRRRP